MAYKKMWVQVIKVFIDDDGDDDDETDNYHDYCDHEYDSIKYVCKLEESIFSAGAITYGWAGG